MRLGPDGLWFSFSTSLILDFCSQKKKRKKKSQNLCIEHKQFFTNEYNLMISAFQCTLTCSSYWYAYYGITSRYADPGPATEGQN